MSNTVIINGNSGRDPELRFTPSGTAVLNGSIADTPRKYDRDTQQWTDAGDTLWLNWAIFGADAERLADTVRKGSRITVYGRLKARSYTTRDGDQRTTTEITADAITVHDTHKQQPAAAPRASNDDPWASEPAPF